MLFALRPPLGASACLATRPPAPCAPFPTKRLPRHAAAPLATLHATHGWRHPEPCCPVLCCSAAEVPAELSPQQHAPLQPPTPEPVPWQHHDVANFNAEREVANQLGPYPEAARARAEELQQRHGMASWHQQGRGLRVPDAGMRRQHAGGGVQFAGLDFGDEEAPARHIAAHRRQHAGGDAGAAGGGSGAGSGAGRAGQVARPRGEAARHSTQRRRRRTAAAGGGQGARRRHGSGGERMYRGGAREDELPDRGVLLGSGEGGRGPRDAAHLAQSGLITVGGKWLPIATAFCTCSSPTAWPVPVKWCPRWPAC